ncbi:unnamed protein product [Toxocara canis]|uniref:Metalloendopeptidase n=1 Tax=Toxocara canis TaxID=6265 RepID=A0A183V8Q9_TOXCA|nr:unnamed protein product [Toxocara canis]
MSGLLLQMKELAHSQTFGDRLFSHDSASDSKKEVSISIEQPKTVNKLTPYLFEGKLDDRSKKPFRSEHSGIIYGNFFAGDILLSTKQAAAILETISMRPSKRRRSKLKPKDFDRRRRSFSSDPEAKWIEFPIKYRFHESLALFQITQIINAIEYWQSHTCLTFQNDDKATGDFIEFFKGEGCYSMIGRFGGRQGVSIGDGCERVGTIEHELGHALGLWHEQSRPDASQYVEVLKAFILPSYISDFLERGTDEIDTLGVPYDLGSVMHYGSTAFSADQKSKTLLTRDPFYQTTIGQREGLSFYDVKIINEAYCKGKTECKNGGYTNPHDCKSCLCPSGFGGAKCEINEKALESQCGGVLKANDKWQTVESPGYPDSDARIEMEFVDEFDIFCATTCVDYVELKIGNDLRNTGFRFCCPEHPKGNVVSALNQVVVIFRSAIGEAMKPARMTVAPPKKTTTGEEIRLLRVIMFHK